MTHGNKLKAGQLQLGHTDIKGDDESLPFIPAQKSGDEWQLVAKQRSLPILSAEKQLPLEDKRINSNRSPFLRSRKQFYSPRGFKKAANYRKITVRKRMNRAGL
jgi:hypothetical protein